jgi:hypothetical protein
VGEKRLGKRVRCADRNPERELSRGTAATGREDRRKAGGWARIGKLYEIEHFQVPANGSAEEQ